MGEEGAFCLCYTLCLLSYKYGIDINQKTIFIEKETGTMLRLSDHAIKMMEQRLRLEQHRTYQANKIVDNLHHKYFFQHIFQPKR